MNKINLKDLLKENSPGFENRKFGDSLPTLDGVRKAYQAKNNIKEESLNEEYIELISGYGMDDALEQLEDAWLEWKNGPATERQHIKPAQKEMIWYVTKWLKKNIK